MGNRDWGLGTGHWLLILIPHSLTPSSPSSPSSHSPLPTPHSPLPTPHSQILYVSSCSESALSHLVAA
ncbi:hypothetical protein H1Q63_28865 [Desmonostoc muscorum CCALA 125]|nr:hypothetical protein [Desmonostoc muscorum CCALA 125]